MASDAEFGNLAHQLEQLLQSNHKFTRDIYKVLADQSGDLFFSPISLQTSLLFLLSGAHGQTADELRNGLHFVNIKGKGEVKEVLQGMKILLESLKSPNLKISSQMFIAKQYPVKKTYENLVKQYLESAFKHVDFQKSPAKAAAVINSWVAEKTENLFSNVISPNNLGGKTRSILVNAVHFKENWSKYFSSLISVRDKPFYTAVDSFVNIPTMSAFEYLKYTKEESFGVLEIPYKNNDFRFLILLPDEIDGLSKLETELSKMEFRKILDNLSSEPEPVILSLPKMKMEVSIEMADVLKQLGMETMFSNAADFTEMYSLTLENDDYVFVNDIVHKAAIEVNEKGTVAAAFHITSLRGGGYVDNFVDFTADHPFIFMILHQDAILFVGRKIDAV